MFETFVSGLPFGLLLGLFGRLFGLLLFGRGRLFPFGLFGFGLFSRGSLGSRGFAFGLFGFGRFSRGSLGSLGSRGLLLFGPALFGFGLLFGFGFGRLLFGLFSRGSLGSLGSFCSLGSRGLLSFGLFSVLGLAVAGFAFAFGPAAVRLLLRPLLFLDFLLLSKRVKLSWPTTFS